MRFSSQLPSSEHNQVHPSDQSPVRHTPTFTSKSQTLTSSQGQYVDSLRLLAGRTVSNSPLTGVDFLMRNCPGSSKMRLVFPRLKCALFFFADFLSSLRIGESKFTLHNFSPGVFSLTALNRIQNFNCSVIWTLLQPRSISSRLLWRFIAAHAH